MVLPFNPETVELIFSPLWFQGIDNFFDIFSVVTTLLIAFYSFQVYRFTKKNNYRWFSFSLFLISSGFISKILTNLIIYYPNLMYSSIGSFVLMNKIIHASNILFIMGHLAHRFFILSGFFGIYWIVSKSKERNKIPFFIFLLFLTTILSAYAYPAYSMTLVILLAHIVYYYTLNYKKNKNSKTLMILSSFALLLLSQILFIFLFLDITIYVASEIAQLAGYLILLYSYYVLVKSK
jgi:hypothetical protein